MGWPMYARTLSTVLVEFLDRDRSTLKIGDPEAEILSDNPERGTNEPVGIHECGSSGIEVAMENNSKCSRPSSIVYHTSHSGGI